MNEYEHIWYIIITQYLGDKDIYLLCRAFPWIMDRLVICERICYSYEITNKFICCICFARFKDYMTLNRHRFSMHGTKKWDMSIDYGFTVKTPAGRYKCSMCTEEVHFSKIGRWKKHMYNHHEPISCSSCGLYKIGYYTYREHRGIEKKHKCDQCPNTYYWKNSLRYHLKSQHPNWSLMYDTV